MKNGCSVLMFEPGFKSNFPRLRISIVVFRALDTGELDQEEDKWLLESQALFRGTDL